TFLSSILPHFAFLNAIDAHREAELRGESLWFSDISEAMSSGFAILMLVLDTAMFFTIAVFVDWVRCNFENPLSIFRR
ncbi:hypothetical protein PFISCL1PPCAC_3121, partial [Pristionchus fissidentatus]